MSKGALFATVVKSFLQVFLKYFLKIDGSKIMDTVFKKILKKIALSFLIKKKKLSCILLPNKP